MRGNFITDKSGSNNPNYKDGRKGTRLYRIYNNMKTRCYNNDSPSYKYYGGRGITIDKEWLNDFQKFKEWSLNNGYREDLTIDRINYDKGYNPDNCRWVSNKIQSLNRRNNHLVTMLGQSKTLTEWSEEYGINYHTVQDRLKRGWSEYKAITTPPNTKFRKKVVV